MAGREPSRSLALLVYREEARHIIASTRGHSPARQQLSEVGFYSFDGSKGGGGPEGIQGGFRALAKNNEPTDA